MKTHAYMNNQKQNPIQLASTVTYIDYKDVETLRHFINQHARLIPRKRTGLSAAHQRMIARSIKRARFMGLLPFIAQ